MGRIGQMGRIGPMGTGLLLKNSLLGRALAAVRAVDQRGTAILAVTAHRLEACGPFRLVPAQRLRVEPEPAFEGTGPEGQRQGEHEVTGRDGQITFKRGVGKRVDLLGGEGELAQPDHGEQGGILDQ